MNTLKLVQGDGMASDRRRILSENDGVLVATVASLGTDADNTEITAQIVSRFNAAPELLSQRNELADALRDLLVEIAAQSEHLDISAIDRARTVLNTIDEHKREWELTRKTKEAKDPRTSPERLAELAADQHAGVRWFVAQHPSTPAAVLDRLGRDQDDGVRSRVATHPATPAVALDRLALDPNVWVRRKVADHQSSSAVALSLLATDKDAVVRRRVAENPSAPEEALYGLARDQMVSVRAAVARNPSTPFDILDVLSEDKDELVRQLATNHRKV